MPAMPAMNRNATQGTQGNAGDAEQGTPARNCRLWRARLSACADEDAYTRLRVTNALEVRMFEMFKDGRRYVDVRKWKRYRGKENFIPTTKGMCFEDSIFRYLLPEIAKFVGQLVIAPMPAQTSSPLPSGAQVLA